MQTNVVDADADDLLARQRAAAALRHLEPPVDFVGAVDIERQLADVVEVIDDHAGRGETFRAASRAGDGAGEPRPVRREEIDEVIRRRTGSDADDQVARQARLGPGERGGGRGAFLLGEIHGRCSACGATAPAAYAGGPDSDFAGFSSLTARR